jgi:hypothetical protein
MCGAALVLATLSAACNKTSVMGPSDGSGQPQASLAMRVTGSPVNGVQALLVTFSQVNVRRDNGLWVGLTFADGETRTCDLTRLTGGAEALASGEFAAGTFNAVRVDDRGARGTERAGATGITGRARRPLVLGGGRTENADRDVRW